MKEGTKNTLWFFLSEEKILTIKNVLMLLLNISEIFINIKLYFD